MSKRILNPALVLAFAATIYFGITRRDRLDKAAPGVMAIRGGVLIDGTGRPPISDAILLIEGGKISRLFREGEDVIPDGARIIDATGRTVLPGLVDCSTNLVIGSAGPALSVLEFRPNRVLADLRAYLYWGVTTIRNSGDAHSVILRLRDNEREGMLLSPRQYISGPTLTAVGGYPALFLPNSICADATRQLSELDQVRVSIQELADDKVDLIKVVYDSGTQWKPYPKLSLDLLQETVKQAHALGLRVSARTGTLNELKEAVRANVDSIERGATEILDDEAIQLMASHGTYYCPTLSACYADAQPVEAIDDLLEREDVRQTVTADIRDGLAKHEGYFFDLKGNSYINGYFQMVWEASQQNLLLASKSGVKIVMGTGAGNPAVLHGLASHEELRLMVEAGLSPMQALVAASRTAAECVGADDRIGTLEVGKSADILIVDGNPLEDINATKNIRQVIKGGQIIDRSNLFK